ncbi:MAG: lamin tail domain-containing protein [Bacteroides sp.]|uniref:lamin tail domain-containing protein n=2 Tax=Bacteroides sp. TaxID=29523 RepID=UPI001B58D503|nr:lamin tail domain-containing protein [Bacteroides sp.]MBP6065553.1 lamin tail domain-containing protein [Bacteroides sp.]
MRKIIGIICFLSSLCSCSPIIDELSEDSEADLTSKLSWIGETDKFTVSDKEGLRLDDKAKTAGSAFLATPSVRVRGTRWEFRVHLLFQPSINNYARFYLASSADNLSGALNGYFVQIGGKEDNVSLYRQTGDKLQLLATGRALMTGNSSPDVRLKVECDDNGYWTFWTRLKQEPEYIKEQQVWDTGFTTSVCAGVRCFYTASRCNGFVFSHIRITDGVETTTEPRPEEPTEPEEPESPDGPQSATLLFNEVMYHNATNGAEYVELYNASKEAVSLLGWKLEKLTLNGVPIMIGGSIALTNDTLNPSSVAPQSYICFTQSTSVAVLQAKHQVPRTNLVGLKRFLSLNDKGGVLILRSKGGKVMDRCYFGDDAHTNPSKQRVGVSLEKRAPRLASDKESNWVSSAHATGGTPGMPNAVFEN